jgi:hypothetical protein
MDEFLRLSIIGFAIQIAFIGIALWVLTNSSRATRKEAKQARLDAAQAQADARRAQAQASLAAEKLVNANSVVITNLAAIGEMGKATHRIVNNQRTVMLRLIALQAKRIAADNPDDAAAQLAALQASADVLTADETNDASATVAARVEEQKDMPQ